MTTTTALEQRLLRLELALQRREDAEEEQRRLDESLKRHGLIRVAN